MNRHPSAPPLAATLEEELIAIRAKGRRAIEQQSARRASLEAKKRRDAS